MLITIKDTIYDFTTKVAWKGRGGEGETRRGEDGERGGWGEGETRRGGEIILLGCRYIGLAE
ncbi:MAG: hypothetical protein F6K16_22815 [Symploca sp. SIO2B6]|nr:hypothetical protein [Symploca sp. SIO2B6]